MPISPSPYYNDPAMGQIASNLAIAIMGDPEARAKRDLYGAQTSKFNADAEKTRAETVPLVTRGQEYNNLPSSLADLFSAGPVGETPQARASRVAPIMGRVLQAGGGNADQMAGGLSRLFQSVYGVGGEDDQRRSLVMGGHMPGKDFAATTGRADVVAGRDNAAELKKATSVANINAGSAANVARINGDSALARVFAAPLNVAPGHDVYLAPSDPRRAVSGNGGVVHGAPTYDTVRGQAGREIAAIPDGQEVPSMLATLFAGGQAFKPNANQPALVTAKNIDDVVLQAAKTVPGAVAEANGRLSLNPAFEASFDAGAIRRARAAAAESYQKTRNASQAANAYLQALGVKPDATFEEPSFLAQLFGKQSALKEMATSAPPTVSSAAQLPPPEQRQVGMRIMSPRGLVEWTGQSWSPIQPDY